jgi:hypothetical protein
MPALDVFCAAIALVQIFNEAVLFPGAAASGLGTESCLHQCTSFELVNCRSAIAAWIQIASAWIHKGAAALLIDVLLIACFDFVFTGFFFVILFAHARCLPYRFNFYRPILPSNAGIPL